MTIISASPTTWIAAAIGLAAVLGGAVGLARRTVLVPWLRSRFGWRGWSTAQIMTGSFLLLESVPRLLGASRHVVVLLTELGFVLLAAGVIVLMRSEALARRR